jgi:TetR/AcrR family transcriptional regulator, transcriptional repressor for nem operon
LKKHLINVPTGLYCNGVRATATATKAPEATRRKILAAAFDEFYKHGFQGGSLNHIVEVAGTTKGALFHHFSGKQELGYAVVDEIIGPLGRQRWLDPLTNSTNPIADLKRVFRQSVKEDIESKAFAQGCPLNNLAQEMSPLDAGFRTRIDKQYGTWRQRLAAAFAAGMKAGKVRKDIAARDVAALVVAAQMGIWGTGKSSRSPELMVKAGEALCSYLDSLKP